MMNLERFFRSNGLSKEGYEPIISPVGDFYDQYPDINKLDYSKFKKKLDKYIEKRLKPAALNFTVYHYPAYARFLAYDVPKRFELETKLVEEAVEQIERIYQKGHKEHIEKEQNKKKKKAIEEKNKPKQPYESEQKRKSIPKPIKAKDLVESTPHNKEYYASTAKISLNDFIGCLAELQGEYGENRFTNKIIELLKRKPKNEEELKELKRQIHKVIKQLFLFSNRIRGYFVNRYGSSVNNIIDELYQDWCKNIKQETQNEEDQPDKKQESPMSREEKFYEATSTLLVDYSSSPEMVNLWEKINAWQSDPLTIRKTKKTIQEEITKVAEKNLDFKKKLTELYQTDDIEEIAKTISDTWEKQVIENGGTLQKRPIVIPEEEHKEKPTPGLADITSQYIKCAPELAETKKSIMEAAETDDIELYMRTSDEIIKRQINDLRIFLESVKETSPEKVETLMKLVEDVFGVVLQNNYEIDALLEIIESELHYHQVKIGLEKNATIEQLTELSHHNARKIEIDYLEGPTKVRELVLINEPKFGFDTSKDLIVYNEGKNLPEDYEDKYIIGTHFRKSLYEAKLKKTEESKEGYHVDFTRKDWAYRFKPENDIRVFDEEENEVEVDPYLLVEIQREIIGMSKTDNKVNQY